MPIDPQYGQEQQLPGTESDNAEPTEHEKLLADNAARIQELVSQVGPAALLPVQVRFLDLRLHLVTELLFKQIGNQWREPFAVEYESLVADFLDEQLSEIRKQKLSI